MCIFIGYEWLNLIFSRQRIKRLKKEEYELISCMNTLHAYLEKSTRLTDAMRDFVCKHRVGR